MNNLIIFAVIIIFVIIFLWKIFNIRKMEHLTSNSDEAIQNLASLYNKDQLTIGKITASEIVATGNINATGNISATGKVSAAQVIDTSMNSASIKAYIDAQIAAVETRVNARMDNSFTGIQSVYVKKNVPFRMKSNASSTPFSGGYGPYFYAGNHDQSLWRNPDFNHPAHSADHFSFTIE